MQNNTNGEVISRIKSELKRVSADNRLVTNKLIYSVVSKWRSLFVQRQDARNKILKIPYIYQTLPQVELIDVDKVQSKCTAITSDCTIKRTKNRLPTMINGFYGPIIRDVSSLDGSVSLTPTTRQGFVKKANSKNYKYNKDQYYWYEDGYLFFPEIPWDDVMIEAYFEEDVEKYSCIDCGEKSPLRCTSRLKEEFFFPSHLLAELEVQALKELGAMLGIPKDESINKNDNG